MKLSLLIIGFVIASLVLNQISGYLFGRSVLSIFALLAIPLVFSFSSKRDVKLAAKIALLPGFLILAVYYGVGLFK